MDSVPNKVSIYLSIYLTSRAHQLMDEKHDPLVFFIHSDWLIGIFTYFTL